MAEILNTPLGRVRVDHADGVVREIHLGTRRRLTEVRTPVAKDLARYFSGETVDFDRYSVDLSGFTEFERQVYAATRSIPAGELRTYGEIANAIGRPHASRAVGNALGKNPACIVIPCHRVVATNGLGGFTGGIAWKRKLLRLEGALK
ncbi:MAG TPA: methylated-DNA--[protein]-cysteine S-methyltransferase [Thermoplasmata archaeon]|nr:methylated-DNA--[protein]-cysteine S-methyltransferase [Thermoplasmata archaeon]